MATERLIVKNFGPIKDIDIEVKDVNVLIGTTGSGKSTVAKLLAIFRSAEFLIAEDKDSNFKRELVDYNIDHVLRNNTSIKYSSGKLHIRYLKNKITTNILEDELYLAFIADFVKYKDYWSKLSYNSFVMNILSEMVNDSKSLLAEMDSLLNKLEKVEVKLEKVEDAEEEEIIKGIELEIKNFKNDSLAQRYGLLFDSDKKKEKNRLIKKYQDLAPLRESTYFPAERMLFSMVGSSIWGLLKNDITIASCVIDFGTTFEKARKKANSFGVDFLGVNYSFENNESLIQTGDSGKLRLETTSSGIQSTIPMMVVLESIRKEKDSSFLVIEEPEANLFPTAQKKLTEYVVQVVNETKSDLFITTHSPYIITALDNLVQAHNAFRKHPEKEAEIAAIIPKEKWLDFDRVTCYYFDGGTCKSTLDTELRSLGSSEIDEVSLSIAEDFERLTDIQYL